MAFDSLAYVAFFAVVFAAYWTIPKWSARKLLLLICSYVFYAAWNPFFVLLLLATTTFDWVAGRLIEGSRVASTRRLLLIASIAVNLGALTFFKYAQFFANTAVSLLNMAGVHFVPLDLGILLPIGISFYTFESLSYVVDVYQRRVVASRSFLDYGLFVTFFPHLVAGPIVRYGQFEPQCAEAKLWRAAEIGKGAALLVYGLALKRCLADLIFQPAVDPVFAMSADAGFAESWLAATSFSMQVYCDFAGYSLCAIGSALMFGFRLPVNFEAPFSAIGIADLWTRWHMTLAHWMRDYVFVPLGGYRRGRGRGFLNVMITFLLVGLWHGAAWTFVAWGAVHGAMLVAERVIRDRAWDFVKTSNRFARVGLAALTLAGFTVAVVFFRATSMTSAFELLRNMLYLGPHGVPPLIAPMDAEFAVITIGVVFCAQVWLRDRRGWDWLDNATVPWRSVTVGSALAGLLLSPGVSSAFIYFQF